MQRLDIDTYMIFIDLTLTTSGLKIFCFIHLWDITVLSPIIYRAEMFKTVTFDPFELQKWQRTKTYSTLHQKSIYFIIKMICAVVCRHLLLHGNAQLSCCHPQCIGIKSLATVQGNYSDQVSVGLCLQVQALIFYCQIFLLTSTYSSCINWNSQLYM